MLFLNKKLPTSIIFLTNNAEYSVKFRCAFIAKARKALPSWRQQVPVVSSQLEKAGCSTMAGEDLGEIRRSQALPRAPCAAAGFILSSDTVLSITPRWHPGGHSQSFGPLWIFGERRWIRREQEELLSIESLIYGRGLRQIPYWLCGFISPSLQSLSRVMCEGELTVKLCF